ncbi:MAG: hypothetical protein LBB65_06990 [Burkholderiales bacterium]|nr:hypothetical protein [Burkholderiales bacterium]
MIFKNSQQDSSPQPSKSPGACFFDGKIATKLSRLMQKHTIRKTLIRAEAQNDVLFFLRQTQGEQNKSMSSMNHEHAFSFWPFQDAINTASFTTRQVLEGLPILEVYHDHEGDWQFLCGTTLNPKDGKVACMGCMVESDLTLVELANLPHGWRATRIAPGAEWVREPYADSEEDV